ncbi:hypothetical protein U1Q18_030768, partial [Sarracenia purpurea var. burkii]
MTSHEGWGSFGRYVGCRSVVEASVQVGCFVVGGSWFWGGAGLCGVGFSLGWWGVFGVLGGGFRAWWWLFGVGLGCGVWGWFGGPGFLGLVWGWGLGC